MKKIKYVLVAAFVATLAACGTTSTVPLTGRTHRISVSDEQILSLSQQEYSKFMASVKKSADTKNTQMVQRVGRRLATAVETYLRNNGFADDLKNYHWEFNLVQDKQANAFCMPGGKIVVYEGLLPYTQNEASLAIVLGHEIAHAVAKHSAEQLTKQQNQQTGIQLGAGILGAITGNSGLAKTGGEIASTYFSFRNLKYSRDNENEADHMGLIFAAMAGYDPQNAVGFWQRMSSGNTSTSDFLSDHPSDAKRIKNIQGWMPEAMRYYKPGTTAKPASTGRKPTAKRKKGTRR
ncbi:M48 family metallopeptidase [Prevotella dentasini]|uniref:M48 family metallopeptidase n=1 Tax=Prevotella dentasini TaxID=589537 RepID=UPI000468AF58|nr:M48 family metallopeptidase [Prevotella dentasini]